MSLNNRSKGYNAGEFLVQNHPIQDAAIAAVSVQVLITSCYCKTTCQVVKVVSNLADARRQCCDLHTSYTHNSHAVIVVLSTDIAHHISNIKAEADTARQHD